MMDFSKELEKMGEKAKSASSILSAIQSEVKSNALRSMADALEQKKTEIISANQNDVQHAVSVGLSQAKIDRLVLNEKRITAMADGLRSVASQMDPVGKIIEERVRPNNLKIVKVTVPFGVIGIIYESRPNVTADAAGICVKAGNAVILRGGSEAIESNRAIADILSLAAINAGLPDGTIQFIPWIDHAAVTALLKLDKYVDLIIPRGGERLIRAVVADATMPVLKHYKGVCHIFVDEKCDFQQALSIIENAKCQRPGVCNAVETLLISAKCAEKFVPMFAEKMAECSVVLRGDDKFRQFCPTAEVATEEDYYEEYLSLTLAVRIVDDVNQAIEHINHYGSHHSDCILSEIPENIALFQKYVDSAVVYANASTRFTDGGEFGMGAEIGISTDKLHARGPMGADELTTYKYLVVGDGQIRI